MIPSRSLVVAALAAACSLAPANAQNLELGVVGGSLPGPLVLDAGPALYPFELMLIVPSTNSGPTPCWWFDLNDQRSLDIGLDLVGLAWAGLADPNGRFIVSTGLGAASALQDLPLFFQAVTLQFGATLLDRISNPDVIRLGNAGTFRDRFAFFSYERAFATVLPRADRKWMIAGGARGALLAQVATDTTAVYEPMTDAFIPGPTMTTPRSMHTATLLPDGRWLLVGGVNYSNDPQASCEVYDPVADTFAPVAAMSSPRMGHTATLLANGKVLATGGLAAMTVTPTQLQAIHDATNTAELYDPIADAWTPVPNMSTPRAAHAAVPRPDGKVLLVGGISWDPIIILGWLPAVRRSCDLYDPVANTMVAGPQMAVARSLVDPVPLGNNRWLLAGGINAVTFASPGTPTASAEIYDAVANTWTSVGAMATARGNHRGWALGNGQFLLAGGANGSILTPTPLQATEVFSTATNQFAPGPAMTVPRAGAVAHPTPQGQVMLFGGASAGGIIVASTEWYFR